MFGIGKLRNDLQRLRDEFEAFKVDVVKCRSITAHGEPGVVTVSHPLHITQWHHAPQASIMHGDAIIALAEHMGVEFKYYEGSSTPSSVVIQKKAKNK